MALNLRTMNSKAHVALVDIQSHSPVAEESQQQ